MKIKLLIPGLLACLIGCATKTVIIDTSKDVVRLGPDVKGHIYLFRNGAWVPTGSVTLPWGWYAGPPPTIQK